MEVVSAILYQLTKNLQEDESSDLFARLDFCVPEFEFPAYNTKENVLMFLHEDMVAEQKAQEAAAKEQAKLDAQQEKDESGLL